ncbi:MAG: error-prone DNA polymerase [Acidobacteria bacterium]|nr:error-prone DNA polymerase [Acidobacteriota bacterium]
MKRAATPPSNSPPSRDLGYSLPRTGPGAKKEKQRQRDWKHSSRADKPYLELRTASAFSFLEAASAPEDLVDAAAACGISAMALVDTNGVYGAPRFYGAAKKAGLRAIVGAEVVVAQGPLAIPFLDSATRRIENEELRMGRSPDSQSTLRVADAPLTQHPALSTQHSLHSALRTQHSGLRPVPDPPASRIPRFAPRLTLLVESRDGYRNLCKLLTAGALGRPKGDPRYDWELIASHANGLHCITGGDEGPLAHALLTGGEEEARRVLDRLRWIFRDRLHVELQRHRRRDQEHRNQALVAIARSMGLPFVATNGVRQARPSDKDLLDVLSCIRHHTTLDSAGRLLAPNAERHVKSAAEMRDLFADLPEAVDHAVALGSGLEFTLKDLGYQFPDCPLPEGESPISYLRQLTWNEARARFRPLTARAQSQLEKELNMIEKLDLAGYFLIVRDIVQFCKRERILVQGRGSAANSAVCYALSITAVDPVKMELLFERFLSEERGEWPDIDLDLPSGDQREKVIQHVYETYGSRGAAMTANVITYRERSSAREAGKALGFSPEQIDRIAKQVGQWTFGEIREREKLHDDLRAAGLDPDEPRVGHFLRIWMKMLNLPRHLGQHSGGMVMARGRLDEVVPLEPASMPGRVVIQWDKDDCADLGIIKVDLLGLGMLNAIEKMIPMIAEHEKTDVDLAHLPPDDPKVYRMLNEADTVGLFQVESRAQMSSLPRHKPKCFYDIVVQVAIIRPGPIVGGMVNPFFDRRQGKKPVEYPHPCLEPILARTLGVPLFQEQLLRIAMVAAGFTGGEAEELRRAMGFKRSVERMEQIETRLREGMSRNGIEGSAQDQIVKSITSFALYGFPESHAASFALIAYASAYLKAHHPAVFFACLLNAWPMGFYHPATLIKDAQRHGVKVFPVDVQRSGWECRWEDGGVRLGIRYVKGVREATGRRIEAERARGPFSDIDDLTLRCRLRGDQVTKLAEAGALASFGMKRRESLWQAARVARPAGPLLARVAALAGEDSQCRTQNAVASPGGEHIERRVHNAERKNEEIDAAQTAQPDLLHSSVLHSAFDLQCVQDSPLPEMSPFEETLTDYQTMELTTGPHIVEHIREELRSHNVRTAVELERLPHGSRVVTAGAVIVRQRPGTAKGFVFLTLEDETGMSQAIVSPDLYRESRTMIVTSPGLVVEGILQNRDCPPSVRTEKIWPLGMAAEVRSHDFH